MAKPGRIGPAPLTALVAFLGSYGLQCAQCSGTGHVASVSVHMTREGLCVNGSFYQQHRGVQHSPGGQQGRPPSKPSQRSLSWQTPHFTPELLGFQMSAAAPFLT